MFLGAAQAFDRELIKKFKMCLLVQYVQIIESYIWHSEHLELNMKTNTIKLKW